MIATIFFIVAIVLFLLAAFGVGNGRIVPAGLASLSVALLFSAGVPGLG